MRPLKLVMSAFGPYAGRQELELDRLGERGIYLITGDTGTGKTTIFDGITFALYGAPSGSVRDSSMLRCKYADPAAPTYAELTFAYGGREYTVSRGPEYQRPKSRGSGVTLQNAWAELKLPDGRVETGVAEVNRRIEEILGVGREQFSQIAMIAQGDFLKLLLADTRERQSIFRQIFGTDIYRRFQDEIRAELTQLERDMAAGRANLAQSMDGILTDPASELTAPLEQARSARQTGDVLRLLTDLTGEDSERTERMMAEINEIQDRITQLAGAVARGEEQARTRRELEAAREELAGRKTELAALSGELAMEKARLPQGEALEREAARLEERLRDYDRLEEETALLADMELRRSRERRAAEEDGRALERLTGEIRRLKEELAQLEKAGENAAAILREKEAAEARYGELGRLARELEALRSLRRELEAARESYIEGADEADSLRELAAEKRRAFNSEQAGIMAEELKEGSPCPVCGSAVHPRKARKSAAAPTQAQVEEAENSAAQAQAAANRLSAQAAALGGRAEATAQAVSQRMASLLGQGASEEEAEKRLPLLMTGEAQGIAGLEEKLLGERERERRKAELTASLPKKEEELTALTDNAAKRREALSSLQALTEEKKKRLEELRSGLEFPDREGAKARKDRLEAEALAIKNGVERAERAYAAADRAAEALGARIGQLESLLSEAEPTDLSALEALRQELTGQRNSFSQERENVVHRLAVNRAALTAISAGAGAVMELEERYTWLKPLTDTVNGSLAGREKIMLETYVQTAYFDRIVSRANVHLMRMSAGRYDLARRETPQSRRGQSGLELDVVDHYNASVRSVRTLSGGESFIASLALALGLSEEIQAGAGGIKLDTMFVDEGFGSLDEETLAQAMKALRSLTGDSRLVGIISHVSELKQEIGRQILVTRDRSGSSRAEIIV